MIKSILSKILYTQTIDLKRYADILEYPEFLQDLHEHDNDISGIVSVVEEYIPIPIKKQIFDEDEPLINCIFSFMQNEKIKKCVVSLSGGIDSMVLITIIHLLGYEVVAAHINYNNREETGSEQDFIEAWCAYNGIRVYVKNITEIKRANSKRNDYEILTKNIRFQFYKEVLEAEKCDFIMLAHHKDDIVENIFANVCRGRYILDLAVIREKTCINDVNIARPLIDFYKSAIYNFAHKNNVPYFKDTTPDWSIRGKYRNQIYPMIEDAFSTNVKDNLLGLSRQSFEWNQLVSRELIEPFMKSIKYETSSVNFNVEKYRDYPLCFWNVVFMKIFYHFNKNCPSRKGIQTFMKLISYSHNHPGENGHHYNGYVSISKSCTCLVNMYDINIDFKIQI